MTRRTADGGFAGWHVERRLTPRPWVVLAWRLGAVVLALVLGGIAIELSGRSALDLGRHALEGSLGSAYGRYQVTLQATPLVLTALAVAVAARLRLWNVGGEGQLFVGACAAAAVGLFLDGPPPVVLALMLVAGAAGGALWILVPALARIYRDVNEIVTTLLLNFVAILLVTYFAIGPWRDADKGFLQASREVPVRLPLLGGLPAGTVLALVLAAVLGLAFRATRWGYELTIIGGNPAAARFAGMSVRRRMLAAMLLSGALAGVAGAVELAGTAHRLSPTISNEYGFLGIIVAVLANFSPWLIPVVGYLFAALLNAGITLQTQGLSVNAVVALTGLILLLVACGEALGRYRFVRGAPGAGSRPQPTPVEVAGADASPEPSTAPTAGERLPWGS